MIKERNGSIVFTGGEASRFKERLEHPNPEMAQRRINFLREAERKMSVHTDGGKVTIKVK